MGSPPTHWKVVAIKNITSVMRGASPRPIEDTRYFDDDGEYGWVRIADVTRNHQYLSNTEQRLSKLGQSLSVELEPNSLFLSIAGSVGKPMITKIKACIHDGFVYFPQLENESNKFLFYIFDSGQPYKGLGKLGTQLNLNTDTVGSIKIPFPPLPTQQKIADFLDRKTAQIDALIEKKRLLIEKLKEKRLAVITQAVTRGLNPHAPLKDSGIQWLGKVPEHWDILSLHHLVRMRSGESITSSNINDTGDYCVYGGNGIRGFISHYTHDGDYVLIGRQGAHCGNVQYASGKFWASEHAVVANPDWEFDTIWLGETLRAMNLNQYSVSAAQPGLSVEVIGRLKLPVPPLQEQLEIAHYIQTMSSCVDDLSAKSITTIDRLTEYRTALITAAVTGQLEVA